MKSPVVKRPVVLAGRKTSVGLEEAFWNGMKENRASDGASPMPSPRAEQSLTFSARIAPG